MDPGLENIFSLLVRQCAPPIQVGGDGAVSCIPGFHFNYKFLSEFLG